MFQRFNLVDEDDLAKVAWKEPEYERQNERQKKGMLDTMRDMRGSECL